MFRILCAVLLATSLLADEPIAFSAQSIVWTDAPATLPAGSKIAVLEGNPRDEGMFTMRVRVPAGTSLAPHWHPRHERVTILSGAAELGFGSTADATRTIRYGAGSFYVNPPRRTHFLFFPEETVMQMTGIGPWEIHTIEVEEAKPATATLTLRSIDPPAASVLGSATQIAAVVDYDITNFRPAAFYLTMQFETTMPDKTFSSSVVTPGAPRPDILAEAKGTHTIVQNLEPILRNAQLKQPVRLRIFLQEQTSETTSRVLAASDWVEYR
jgi:quercetin dioxygenase-like cupin family protein